VCHRLRRNVKACNKFVAMIRNDRADYYASINVSRAD